MGVPRPGTCRTCKASVLWCETVNDRWIPLDAAPVATGHLVIELQPKQAARAVTYDPLLHAGSRRYVSHFATCPDAAEFRSPRGGE